MAGDLAQAEDAYRVILELAPDHGDANHNLAVIALESGHAAAAVALFRKALDGQPGNQTYWLSWFDAMLQSGDLDGAMDALEHQAAHRECQPPSRRS
ncbi:MAG: tetratricopeptide repeat protein [Rhodoferax sp.]|nr:tetratricopeptide repeat protein [Rhodoferax sp.]